MKSRCGCSLHEFGLFLTDFLDLSMAGFENYPLDFDFYELLVSPALQDTGFHRVKMIHKVSYCLFALGLS